MESFELESEELVTKQKLELDTLVPDIEQNQVILLMMQTSSLGFACLNQFQRRLYIKFLIETVDSLEKYQE